MRTGPPFDCRACSETEKDTRNCFNRKGLGSAARAVEDYTDEIKAELREKNAVKVIGFSGLRLYECPLSYITVDTAAIMRVVFLVESSGQLLFPGGWGSQPQWLVEAYAMYKAENVRRMREDLNERTKD